ncbi:hypothetical protein D3C78_1160690 [compost metagenome]
MMEVRYLHNQLYRIVFWLEEHQLRCQLRCHAALILTNHTDFCQQLAIYPQFIRMKDGRQPQSKPLVPILLAKLYDHPKGCITCTVQPLTI